MPYLLNLVYLVLILLALPWLVFQAVRAGKYREGYAEKLLGRAPPRTSGKKCLWLHAVSVGEVSLLAPLLSLIHQGRPDWECVISTTTMTGIRLARKKYPGHTVFYAPLDFSWAVRTAMRRVRPDVLVLAELELWPNLVWAARRCGARVAVINGRLSERSFRGYRWIRPLVARLLKQMDLVAAQDETYAGRFRTLGALPTAVHVTGSMKYDGAQTDRGNPATQRLAQLAGFAADDVVFLAGSTQEPEESLALDVYRQLCPAWPKLRLVIVPRHPERFEAVARLLAASGVAWQRRTELGPASLETGESSSLSVRSGAVPNASPQAKTETGPAARVLLVDSVGELGAWWGTAQIALVGGSLGRRGGQNMIEPAAYGAAVAFGPNTRNFRDIVSAMLAHEAAVVVVDGRQLLDFVRRCLEQPAEAAALGDRARRLVLGQLGATQRTFGLLERLV
ncbi:MAG: 3-deoxy-D-manno-octulosonic acid transferase [Thermoguttaceae bacterium]